MYKVYSVFPRQTNPAYLHLIYISLEHFTCGDSRNWFTLIDLAHVGPSRKHVIKWTSNNQIKLYRVDTFITRDLCLPQTEIISFVQGAAITIQFAYKSHMNNT